MWVIAAVQIFRPAAASTAPESLLVSAAVGKDRRSTSIGRGKQTIAAAVEPPDSKGTNRMSIVVADISPAAWRTAPSRAASSGHWPKSPHTFSLAVTVSGPGKIIRSASAPCTARQW